MKKFILRAEGGLGNQMFQYAHIRALQLRNGGSILIDGSCFNKRQTLSLSLFNLKLNKDDVIRHPSLFYRLLFQLSPFWVRVVRKLNLVHDQLSYLKFARHGLFWQYKDSYFDSFAVSHNRINYVVGNWMSEKYFLQYRDIIKKELRVNVPTSPKNYELLDKIRNCNSVCLHIRRGDYCSAQWSKKLLICDYEYYRESIEYMKSALVSPVFFVFSNNHDDIEWIKSHYSFNADLFYVDNSNLDYQDLELMYNCHHFILSNSTYSWWAQYLSDYEEKVVVAPSKWNAGNWNVDDIYMSNWKLIDIK